MQNKIDNLDKLLEDDYERFHSTFLRLLKDYKKKTKRLDKIIEQSDRQQFRLLKMNEELEDYKQRLENRIETDKMIFQKAREAQMGEMISMIAHQWRQPLTAIGADIISMQLDQMTLDPNLLDKKCLDQIFKKQSEKFIRINEQVKLLSSTIDDFRNFFKPTKKKQQVCLSDLVLRVLSIIQIELESEGIIVITNFDAKEMICVHFNEILQVMINLLNNSKDSFLNSQIENKIITIDIVRVNDDLKLIITDNAGGIPKDILPKIFDPYFSTKHDKNGTGIGLYMAKMIIEEHNNGKIIAKNTQDGASFEIIWDLKAKIEKGNGIDGNK